MNWLDIILIIINVIIVIGGIVWIVICVYDEGITGFITGLISSVFICGIIMILTIGFFIVMDKGSGSTIGTITSIDKNFFGTTSLYIKTSENSQEKYCIENNDIVEQAKLLIGKNVKIEYGERVGLYSTNKCHQAPVEKIEETKE